MEKKDQLQKEAKFKLPYLNGVFCQKVLDLQLLMVFNSGRDVQLQSNVMLNCAMLMHVILSIVLLKFLSHLPHEQA